MRSLKLWLEAHLPQLAARSRLAEAIRHALERWDALGPPAPMAAAADGDSLCSVIEIGRLNDVEPYAYLRDGMVTVIRSIDPTSAALGLEDAEPRQS